MSRLDFADMAELPRLRRMMRHQTLRITVRHGRVFTYKLVKQHQPNSAEQMAQRDVFRRANAIVAKELKNAERLTYWREVAKSTGQKTARGAAIAWWCAELKKKDAAMAAKQMIANVKTDVPISANADLAAKCLASIQNKEFSRKERTEKTYMCRLLPKLSPNMVHDGTFVSTD